MGRASQNSLPREMYVAFYRDSCLNCGSRRQLSHGPLLPGEFFWVLHSPLPNSLALYSEGPEHRRFVGATWGRVWDPVPIHSGYLPSALQWICSSMYYICAGRDLIPAGMCKYLLVSGLQCGRPPFFVSLFLSLFLHVSTKQALISTSFASSSGNWMHRYRLDTWCAAWG